MTQRTFGAGRNDGLLVLIEHILAHIDFLTQTIAAVQVAIERCLPAYEEALALLQTTTGIKPIAAAVHSGRARDRYGSLPECWAPGILGRTLPEQQGERWKAHEGTNR